MQLLARANLIFGLHVHVGIPDRETAIHVMNQARYFLPHIYALSVNSPFWVGRNTGLKGYRLKVFERFPRTGIPDAFESLSEYEDFCKLLVKTGCIDNPKKIWWDIRLHPFFDTLEVRVCDAQSRVDDTLAIAALIQAVVAKLYKLLRQNTTFRVYRRRLLDENRWRASRYGIDGKLIDFGRETEVETRSLLNELLEFVSTEVDELGSKSEMAHIERIMREGTGADRQLAVWEQTNRHERGGRSDRARNLRTTHGPGAQCRRLGTGETAAGTAIAPLLFSRNAQRFFMPDRSLLISVDPELTPGARNAVRVCLRAEDRTNGSRLSPTRRRARSRPRCKQEVEEVGAEHAVFVLEESRLASAYRNAGSHSRRSGAFAGFSIFCAQTQPGELGSRMQMTAMS